MVRRRRGCAREPLQISPMAAENCSTFQTSDGRVRVVTREHVEGVAAWAVGFAEHRQDHRYYRIVEETILQGFVYRYLVIEDGQGKVQGVQPCFLLDQDVLELSLIHI